MGGGTPFKLMSGECRVTRIMFICDREAPPVGMVSASLVWHGECM